jgi:hypothetical protein
LHSTVELLLSSRLQHPLPDVQDFNVLPTFAVFGQILGATVNAVLVIRNG